MADSVPLQPRCANGAAFCEAAFDKLIAEGQLSRDENEELWRALKLAKAQRDRAIRVANVNYRRGDTEYWHPDMDGGYNLD